MRPTPKPIAMRLLSNEISPMVKDALVRGRLENSMVDTALH